MACGHLSDVTTALESLYTRGWTEENPGAGSGV